MFIITGGAGFLGSALIWELNQQGIDDILVVDNLALTEKWKNLVGLRYADYMHRDAFIKSIHQYGLQSSVQGVVHLGACSATTERDADFLMQNNFHYSRDLCLAATKAGVRFINASSAATYGDGSIGFNDDEDSLNKLRPLNMYGYSKQLFDLWIQRHHLLCKVVSLKFFNVYGPNEYHKQNMRSVVCKAHSEIKQHKTLQLFRSNHPDYADGGQMRDFIYVKDCTRIMAWLLHNKSVNGIYNVGMGKARTWNDLAKSVFDAMGLPVNIKYIDMPVELHGKYQNFTKAPMQKLLQSGCPLPSYELEDGIKDYVQNYLSCGKYLDIM